MQKSCHSAWLQDIVILLLLTGVLYFTYLGSHPLFVPDEGRYAEIGREMMVSGDYITPTLNGVPFLDKPILHYWLQATAMKIMGVNEWAVRFFPALFGVIGVLITYISGRLLFTRRVGVIASAVLATAPLYFIASHYANLDLEVGVLISASLLLFLSGTQTVGRLRGILLISAYIFAALAILTKGLIGILFPSMIVGCWIILLWQWSLLKSVRLFTGLLIILCINIPWYVLAQKQNPEFLHYFFITQQVTRFLSQATFNNMMPIWFYLPAMLAGFGLWLFFIPQVIYVNMKKVWRNREAHPIELFLLLTVGMILVFFSIPHSKIVTYILPLFPALSLLIAVYLDQHFLRLKKWAVAFVAVSAIGLVVINAKSADFMSSNKMITLELKAIKKPDDVVIHYEKYFYDVPFYLNETVSIAADWNMKEIQTKDNWQREMEFAAFVPESRERLINQDALMKRWHGEKRVFVFVPGNELEIFKVLFPEAVVISESNDKTILVSNRM